LRARIDEIGLPKTVVAAHHIIEIDPFASLSVYPSGVTDGDVESFFCVEAPVRSTMSSLPARTADIGPHRLGLVAHVERRRESPGTVY
jgi:hypothetical protein